MFFAKVKRGEEKAFIANREESYVKEIDVLLGKGDLSTAKRLRLNINKASVTGEVPGSLIEWLLSLEEKAVEELNDISTTVLEILLKYYKDEEIDRNGEEDSLCKVFAMLIKAGANYLDFLSEKSLVDKTFHLSVALEHIIIKAIKLSGRDAAGIISDFIYLDGQKDLQDFFIKENIVSKDALIRHFSEQGLKRNLKRLHKSFSGFDIFCYVNKKDTIINKSALHLAAENGHTELCKYLIRDMNADINVFSSEEYITPFYLACKNAHFDTALKLIPMMEKLNQKSIDAICKMFKISEPYTLEKIGERLSLLVQITQLDKGKKASMKIDDFGGLLVDGISNETLRAFYISFKDKFLSEVNSGEIGKYCKIEKKPEESIEPFVLRIDLGNFYLLNECHCDLQGSLTCKKK